LISISLGGISLKKEEKQQINNNVKQLIQTPIKIVAVALISNSIIERKKNSSKTNITIQISIIVHCLLSPRLDPSSLFTSSFEKMLQ